MKGVTLGCLVLALAAGFPESVRLEGSDLDAGIRLVKDGDFEAAVLTLDDVIRQLGKTERKRDLAQAYVYLGVAYLGLGQEALARNKFRLALREQPELRLSPEEFSAKTIRVFEAARQAEQSAAAVGKAAKKSRGKGGLILLGLGGAAAAGVAAQVATKERENRPPTATIAITPEGQAIARITALTLTATGSDPDGDAVSFSWAFGDGGTAAGPSVTYTYSRAGQFQVVLTARDGLASSTTPATVTARTLTGTWRVAGPAPGRVTAFQIDDEADSSGSPGFVAIFPGGRTSFRGGRATLSHPRNIEATSSDPAFGGDMGGCPFHLQGQVDAALQRISGTLTCVIRANCLEVCSPHEAQITATRQ